MAMSLPDSMGLKASAGVAIKLAHGRFEITEKTIEPHSQSLSLHSQSLSLQGTLLWLVMAALRTVAVPACRQGSLFTRIGTLIHVLCARSVRCCLGRSRTCSKARKTMTQPTREQLATSASRLVQGQQGPQSDQCVLTESTCLPTRCCNPSPPARPVTQKHAIAVRPEAELSCEDGTWSSVCVRATGQSSQVLACGGATLDFSRCAHSAYLFPAACRDDRQ